MKKNPDDLCHCGSKKRYRSCHKPKDDRNRMFLFIGVCYGLIEWHAAACPFAVWKSCLILFVLAWIGQFIGHKIEGKKPSFFHDVVFLLIGPAWLMHFVYRKLGLKY